VVRELIEDGCNIHDVSLAHLERCDMLMMSSCAFKLLSKPNELFGKMQVSSVRIHSD